MASGEAALLLLAWALARWLDVSVFEHFRPSSASLLVGVLATIPLLLALAWMLGSSSPPIRRLVALVVEQMGPFLASCTVLELGILAAVAGFCEEALFRGVVQVGMGRWVSEGWALLAASVAFGAVHFATPTYALFAGIMGLYLGLVFLAQQSLLAPIVAHGLYDFVALIYVSRRYRLGHARSSEMEPEPAARQ